jgi:hypothetical protein
MGSFRFDSRAEDDRLDAHFEWVLMLLQAQRLDGLSARRRAARSATLARVAAYKRRRRFPRNTTHRDRMVPTFVDVYGTTCAVADLLLSTGRHDLVEEIHRTMTLSAVAEMHVPALPTWAAESGLTMAEVELIQPDYDCAPDVCETHAGGHPCNFTLAPDGTECAWSPCGDSTCLEGACIQQPKADGTECGSSLCGNSTCLGGACVQQVEPDGTECGFTEGCVNATCHSGECNGLEHVCSDDDRDTKDVCDPHTHTCQHFHPLDASGGTGCALRPHQDSEQITSSAAPLLAAVFLLGLIARRSRRRPVKGSRASSRSIARDRAL